MTYPPQQPDPQHPAQPPQGPPTQQPPTHTAPPKKGVSSGTGAFIIICLVVLCCGGAYLATNDNSTSPTGSDTQVAAPAPAATTANPIHEWYAAGGQDRLNALSADLSKFTAAGQAGDFPAARSACAAEQKDVETAQAYRPFPDSEGQKWWAAALAATARAATDCVASVDTMSTDLMARSGSEFREATDDLLKLAARKQELGV